MHTGHAARQIAFARRNRAAERRLGISAAERRLGIGAAEQCQSRLQTRDR